MFDIFKKNAALLTAIADELARKESILIDVRTPLEFASGHARGAKNIPLELIETHAKELAEEVRVYLICQSGGRSARATTILGALGVSAVNVPGGTLAWSMSGLPME